MTRRGVETGLAIWTLALLAIYIPGETWASWHSGLLDPGYLVDVIAMILLLWGAIHSLRRRPGHSPELLCIASAWTSANGWRVTFWRYEHLQSGGTLTHGSTEMWVVAIATGISLATFILLLILVTLKLQREAATQ